MNKRISWLDNARAFAILSVVFVHATENIYIMKVEYLNSISLPSMLFAHIGFTFGRLGVPIFLFLTGYLLLDRKFELNDCYKFWHKNWKSLLITTEIWIIIYDVFLRVFHFQHWNTLGLIKDMLFMTSVHMGHMWYMPMIIGLYICIPFMARGISKLNIKVLLFPLTILGFYAFVIPIINVINKIFSFKIINPMIDLGFIGGVYGIYLILGFCIKKGLLKNFSTRFIMILCICFFILTVLLQLTAYQNNIKYNVWYNCGFLIICCLSLFELFSRINILKQEFKLSTWISKNSFGIYLIHFPFIMLLRDLIKTISVIMPIKVILLWSLVLIISSIICYIINIFPKISKLLLYNR